MLVETQKKITTSTRLLRQSTYFVTTNMLVKTMLLSQQVYLCRDKTRLLSWQTFVVTLLLSQQNILAATPASDTPHLHWLNLIPAASTSHVPFVFCTGSEDVCVCVCVCVCVGGGSTVNCQSKLSARATCRCLFSTMKVNRCQVTAVADCYVHWGECHTTEAEWHWGRAHRQRIVLTGSATTEEVRQTRRTPRLPLQTMSQLRPEQRRCSHSLTKVRSLYPSF